MMIKDILPYFLAALVAICVAALVIWLSHGTGDTLPQDYGVM